MVMRLKTLRKERPAFESEGAVINGNRMDLTNNDSKQTRFRVNKAFALPTSLNNDLKSLNISRSETSDDFLVEHPHQASTRHLGTESNESDRAGQHLSAYQAIEAAYLEHGIRIHLNSTTSQVKNQTATPKTSSHRSRAFVNRNPSRSSSALQYSTVAHQTHQDFRPFSALHNATNNELQSNEQNNGRHRNQREFSHLPTDSNNDYSSTSLLGSEHSSSASPNELNSQSKRHKLTLLDEDPDLIYMTKLLTTANGDAYRDTIRRRAGLRGTFAIHRHPSSNKNSSTDKRSEKASVTQSSVAQRSTVARRSVLPTPVSPTPMTKKIEKDIIKHASRIRTSHSKECLLYPSSPLRSVKTTNNTPSISTSPTRQFNNSTNQNRTKKSSKPITLEPLELLLAPSQSCSPTPGKSFPQSCRSLVFENDNFNKRQAPFSSKSIDSLMINSLMNSIPSELRSSSVTLSNVSSRTSSSSSSSAKPFPIYVTTTIRKREESFVEPIDCDPVTQVDSDDGINSERSSSSLHHSPGSSRSARLTSASTCASKSVKRVSFGISPTTYFITKSTYV